MDSTSSTGSKLKKIGLALVAILVVLVLVLAGVTVYDVAFGVAATDFTNVTYPGSEAQTLDGYLAQPEGPGPHPAVLMLHEWWGLNEDITHLADALAAQGYVVLAPDAYRERTATQVPGALYLRLSTPDEQIAADIDAAFNYLRDLDTVDPARVASLGFCFGGEQSLQLGLRHPEDLAATVIYYGSLVTEESTLRPLVGNQPILGIFGEEDAQIPVSEVRAFETALNDLGIENEIIIYPNVGHAFLNSENYNEPGPTGLAWQQTLAFLAANVQ